MCRRSFNQETPGTMTGVCRVAKVSHGSPGSGNLRRRLWPDDWIPARASLGRNDEPGSWTQAADLIGVM
jgi:hypothetical protein